MTWPLRREILRAGGAQDDRPTAGGDAGAEPAARRAGDFIAGAHIGTPQRHGGAVIPTPLRRGAGPTAMWPPPTLPRRGAAATARAVGMAPGQIASNAHHCRGFGGPQVRPTGVRGQRRPQNRHSRCSERSFAAAPLRMTGRQPAGMRGRSLPHAVPAIALRAPTLGRPNGMAVR